MSKYFNALVLFLFVVSSTGAQTIKYITPTGAGLKDGSSWTNAADSSQLQSLINGSSVNTNIWLAAGTYKPTAYPQNCITCNQVRKRVIKLKDGVSLTGGFAGNETNSNQADPALNPTILSGDIGVLGDTTDNCYHVLLALSVGVNNPTSISGLTITFGNANGFQDDTLSPFAAIDNERGGGAHIQNSRLQITNCTFKQNAAYYGGGIYTYGGANYISANFTQNTSHGDGGAIDLKLGGNRLESCRIWNNRAYDRGGGINIDGGANHIFRCEVSNNKSGFGAGIAMQESYDTIMSCVIDSNTTDASGHGGGLYTTSCQLRVANCIFYDNRTFGNGYGGAVMHVTSNDQFTNCTFYRNLSGHDRWFSNFGATATYTNCIEWGSSGSGLYYNNPFNNPIGTQLFITCDLSQQVGTQLNVDPQFVNVSNPKGADGMWGTADDGFNLACTSPVRNIGTIQGIANTDIVGNTRPQNSFDLGAFQCTIPIAVPAVNITQIPVCSGNAATFVANTTNGGTTPSYQWKIGGVAAGTNNDTLVATVNNNAVVTCTLTSNATCAVPTTVSDTLLANIVNIGTPVLTISAVSDTNICTMFAVNAGVVAQVANAGTTIHYQWKLNGQLAGTDSNLFTPAVVNSGDEVTCTVTSNSMCTGTVSASSNILHFHIIGGTRIYVAPNATGNGSSWANATGDLTAALNNANSCTEIWVKEGDYYPTAYPPNCTTCSVNRNYAFELKNGVVLYGGFVGNETSPAQRNLALHYSALDGWPGGYQVAHVVVSADNDSTAVLDGFRILDGKADMSTDVTIKGYVFSGYRGGGMSLMHSGPTVRNCTFFSNSATFEGSALYNYSATPFNGGSFTACNIRSNTGSHGSGAVYNYRVNSAFSKCIFLYNAGAPDVFNAEDTVSFSGCVFDNNNGSSYASAVVNTATQGLFVNCVFRSTVRVGGCSDRASSVFMFCTFNGLFNGGQEPLVFSDVDTTSIVANSIVETYSSSNAFHDCGGLTNSVHVSNCIIRPQGYFGGTNILTANPSFRDSLNSIGPDNKYITADDGFQLRCSSPAIRAGFTTSLTNVDILGNPRSNPPDIGAYQVSGDPPVVHIQTANDTLCSSITASFSSTVTGAPPTAVYQWYVNGTAVGTNNMAFTANNLAGGDKITLRVSANYLCDSTVYGYSDTITMHAPVATVSAPTITVSGPVSFCPGDSVTLTASGGNNYLWSTGAATNNITVKVAGNYRVNVHDPVTGCLVPSAQTTVVVYPSPTATVTASGSLNICLTESVTLSVPAGNTYVWSTGAHTQNITVSQAGTYTVTVSDANNCTASSTPTGVTNVVSVVPQANVSASKLIICTGETVSFTAALSNGGNNPSLLWKKNGASLGFSGNPYSTSSITNGDNFTAQLTSNAYCAIPAQVESQPVTITVSIPAVPVISQSGNTLNSSSITGNQWYLNGNIIPGASSPGFIPTQTGNYTVVVTDNNGCPSQPSNVIHVTVTGIGEIANDLIVLLPNPALNELNIHSSGLAIERIVIYNFAGQVVLNIYQPRSNRMDVSDLPPGFYVAEINIESRPDRTDHRVRKCWIKM